MDAARLTADRQGLRAGGGEYRRTPQRGPQLRETIARIALPVMLGRPEAPRIEGAGAALGPVPILPPAFLFGPFPGSGVLA